MSFYGIKIGDEAVWGMRFGQNLRRIVETKKMTLSDIGNKVGVSGTMISAYMHGSTIPNYYKMCKLAEALECDIGELTVFSLESEPFDDDSEE